LNLKTLLQRLFDVRDFSGDGGKKAANCCGEYVPIKYPYIS